VYRIEDLPPRVAAKIRVNPVTGCWEWQGHLKPKGYGQIAQRDGSEKGPDGRGKVRCHLTHRLVYSILVGPIPDGLPLDHVKERGCASNACCWPAHLEPVTHLENNRRAAARRVPRGEGCRQRRVSRP
jgi:hypothetical protein